MAYKVVHYINQFFAGIGGEEMAGHRPEARKGFVGPGQAFNAAFGSGAEIVGTVICGDTYFADNLEKAEKEVLELIKSFSPDAVVAGPAFNAGRYGTACGSVCEAVRRDMGIPTVSGMYLENPGVDMFRKSTYILSTADSARGMKDALVEIVSLSRKIISGSVLGAADDEGYISRGIRKNFFHETNGARRAVDMLLKKISGQPFRTEYEMPVFKRIIPADPVRDIRKATIALVSSGGIVPRGNPDRIRVSSAESYGVYDISKIDDLTPEIFESIHGGYDRVWANDDPDTVLALDIMREMEREGVFGKLYDYVFTTTGTGTAVAHAERFGQEIGKRLKEEGVDAAILTST